MGRDTFYYSSLLKAIQPDLEHFQLIDLLSSAPPKGLSPITLKILRVFFLCLSSIRTALLRDAH